MLHELIAFTQPAGQGPALEVARFPAFMLPLLQEIEMEWSQNERGDRMVR